MFKLLNSNSNFTHNVKPIPLHSLDFQTRNVTRQELNILSTSPNEQNISQNTTA